MNDKLSALMDGQLDDRELDAVLAAVIGDDDARADWDCYCQIGDVIRGDAEPQGDLLSRVMAELNAEPALVAVHAPVRVRQAANDSLFGRLLPVAASVAGVAAVAWVMMSNSGPVPGSVAAPAVAAAVVKPAQEASAVAVRDELQRHREYVLAHQGMVAGGPIPGGVQYVRTVSDVRGAGR